MKYQAKTDIYPRYKNGMPSNKETWSEEWLHNPINQFPIEQHHPWRLKHNLVQPPERGDPMTKGQKDYIRNLLYLPGNGEFPRCKHRNMSFVRRQEEQGDFSHSKKGHLCRECRCKKPAGFGTKGDFYGIGENTGHYGCGLCRDHEKTMSRHQCLGVAAWDLWTIRTYGDFMADITEYEDRVGMEAVNASIRIGVRSEMEVVQTVIADLTETLIPKQTQNVVDALEALTDAVGKAQFVDPEQGQRIEEILESKILERTKLTEYQQGKLCSLSSKTEIELKTKAAMGLSKINWNNFKLEQADYLHFDELSKRMDMHLSIEKRSLQRLREKLANFQEGDEDPCEEVYKWAVAEIKSAWDGAKTGAKH